nr:immunoglobulin heavy chain junction region [Macaca mulatta]MOX58594.1 immunoglobulin heavy chain junction region [Macaca mulatta]MOX58702.1 immunoglobulin heavy chain junction region [Macaca mulatta]MOX58805.1 immunoglobulin heavy chain junction region [Macaca mulatta]MOX59002.1 immunoglobulin heavy chain junction region [Macaca mulatta]
CVRYEDESINYHFDFW